MATIYQEFVVDAPAEFVWQAIKDVGSVHSRLAQGFVASTKLAGRERTVTFANGFVARERIIGVNDDVRRLSYCVVGGRVSHHNAYFQVFSESEGRSRIVWVTDLLPDEAQAHVELMVGQGAEAIKRTLEHSFLAAK